MVRNTPIFGLVVVCAGMMCTPGAHAGKPFSLFSAPTGDVVIVTDITEAGKAFEAPSKEAPMHCLALNFGCSFGSTLGDDLPDPAEMGAFLGKLLAEQGYQGSDENNPPQLLITLQWGTIQSRTGYALAFLGADKVGLDKELGVLRQYERSIVPEAAQNPAAFKIRHMAEEDLYVATVCGFDFEAYQAGRAEMLWKTRIACSVTGLSMAKALPEIVTLAAPAIGRETKGVIVTNPADKREGRVRFGELEVVEGEDAGAARK